MIRDADLRQVGGQHLAPPGVAGAGGVGQLAGLVSDSGIPADPDTAGVGCLCQRNGTQCAAHYGDVHGITGHSICLPARHDGEDIAIGSHNLLRPRGQNTAPRKAATPRKDQHLSAVRAGHGDLGTVNALAGDLDPQPHRQAAVGGVLSSQGRGSGSLQAVFALPYIGNRCARIPPQRQKTAVCLRDMQPRIGVVDRAGHKAKACFAVIVWRALRMVPSELHWCTLPGTFTDPFDKKWGRCPAAAPTAHKVYAILFLLISRPERHPHRSGSASRQGSPDNRHPDTLGCTRHTWTQTGRGCR